MQFVNGCSSSPLSPNPLLLLKPNARPSCRMEVSHCNLLHRLQWLHAYRYRIPLISSAILHHSHLHWSVAEGACGYGDLHKSYGKYTTGLSGMLFDRGSSCGACFEIRSAQLPQATPPILVTATDFCPPNYALPADHGGWCNFPRAHFHLPEATFSLISHLKPQLLSIQYRRYIKNQSLVMWL